MNLKEKIENNLTLYTLGLLCTGFIAGIGVYRGVIEIAGPKAVDMSQSAWDSAARAAGWIPKTECPAFPIALTLTSPGAGSVVGARNDAIYSDVVIQASRPLPSSNAVGLVLNQEGDPNHYVLTSFGLRPDDSRRVFRSEKYIFLPFKVKPEGKLNMWAFVADDSAKLGTVYGSLGQIQKGSPEITISEKVVINLRPE